jgi:hypothetical protein
LPFHGSTSFEGCHRDVLAVGAKYPARSTIPVLSARSLSPRDGRAKRDTEPIPPLPLPAVDATKTAQRRAAGIINLLSHLGCSAERHRAPGSQRRPSYRAAFSSYWRPAEVRAENPPPQDGCVNAQGPDRLLAASDWPRWMILGWPAAPAKQAGAWRTSMSSPVPSTRSRLMRWRPAALRPVQRRWRHYGPLLVRFLRRPSPPVDPAVHCLCPELAAILPGGVQHS